MTLAAQTIRYQYSGNDVTTAFSFPRKFFDNDDLIVVLTNDEGVDSVLDIDDDYTVSGEGESAGGTVTILSAPETGETLTIYRDPELAQTLDLEINGSLPVEDVEEAFDRVYACLQRLDERFDRQLQLAESDASGTLYLPLADERAGMFLGFDDDGNPIASTMLEEGAAISAYISTLVDDVTAAEARATLGFSGLLGTVASENLGIGALSSFVGVINGSLAGSVSGNALTINLKTISGNTPSSSDRVIGNFRSATAGSGTYERVDLTDALALVLTSGSDLGTANSTPFRLWIVLFNDGGTLRLGAINCLSGTNVYPLQDDILASSTAEGAAGAADSAQVIYTGTAVSAKALRVLGYMEWASGLSTKGVWDTAPSKVQMFAIGGRLPGQIVQTYFNPTGSTAAGSTVIPLDDTVPQITEGDQYVTQAITPLSKANILAIEGRLIAGLTDDGAVLALALFQDATAGALAVSAQTAGGTDAMMQVGIRHEMLASILTATTFRLRCGGSSGTVRLNGAGAARKFGGVLNSYLKVTEIMG